MSVATSVAAEYQTMSCSDIMVGAETDSQTEAAFEEEEHAHTLRTINHILSEQKAEVACLLASVNCESKVVFVSPSYTDVQRALLHQRIAISLLPTDHPIRSRYFTHSYYVYTFERILI